MCCKAHARPRSTSSPPFSPTLAPSAVRKQAPPRPRVWPPALARLLCGRSRPAFSAHKRPRPAFPHPRSPYGWSKHFGHGWCQATLWERPPKHTGVQKTHGRRRSGPPWEKLTPPWKKLPTPWKKVSTAWKKVPTAARFSGVCGHAAVGRGWGVGGACRGQESGVSSGGSLALVVSPFSRQASSWPTRLPRPLVSCLPASS